jgi:hypothetical protein
MPLPRVTIHRLAGIIRVELTENHLEISMLQRFIPALAMAVVLTACGGSDSGSATSTESGSSMLVDGGASEGEPTGLDVTSADLVVVDAERTVGDTTDVSIWDSVSNAPTDAKPALLDGGASEPTDGGAAEPKDDMDEPEPAPCVDHAGYFLENMAGPVFSKCLGCHNAYGLVPEFNKNNDWGIWTGRLPGDPDYLEWNLSVLKGLASYMADKASQNGMTHQGGTVFEPDSEFYNHFQTIYELLGSSEACDTAAPSSVFEDAEWLSAKETYRKASLLLNDTLPAPDILQGVDEDNLVEHIDGLMEKPAFLDRIEEAFNDVLLTESFHPNPLSPAALANLPYDTSKGHAYPRRYLFRPCSEFTGGCCAGTDADPCCVDLFPDDLEFCAAGQEHDNRSITSIPLKLVRHVVVNNLPFREILTADYTMANPFVAAIFGLDLAAWEDLTDPSDYKPVQVVSTPNNVIDTGSVPHAGLLTTHMFLRRYITTRTNLNRMRTRIVYDRFLDIDLEALAEFTVDQNETLPANPTYDGNVCRICHAAMDPVAGFFMYRNRRGAYSLAEGDGWKSAKLCSSESMGDPTKCVRDPAYKSDKLDLAEQVPLQVLANHLTTDDRFALAMVQHLVTALLGNDIVRLPDDVEHPLYSAKVQAWRIQDEIIGAVRQIFVDSNHDLKAAMRALVLGPLFRLDQLPSQGEVTDNALALIGAGGGRLLSPEELDRKVVALTGYPWRVYYTQPPRAQNRLRLLWQFPILYGGIDSKVVVERHREPNGVISSIARRMATQMSCLSVPQDFAIVDADARRYFRHVEADTSVDDPAAEDAVREDIRGLYLSLLGEEYAAEHEEIEAAYQLLLSIKQAGLSRVVAGDEGGNLPSWCQARCDYWFTDFPVNKTWHSNCSNVPVELHYQNLDSHQPMVADLTYNVRAWQALVAALLADYRFLYY